MAMLVITRGYISKHLKTRPVRRSWDFLSASTSASVGGDPRNCTWGFLAKPWYQWDRHINGISSGAYNFHDSIVTEKSRTAERMALGPWVPGLGFSRLFNRNRDFLPRNSPWSILKTDPLNSDIPKKNRSHRKLRKLRKLDTFPRRGKRSNQAIPCHPNCNRRFKTNIRIPGGRCQLNHELSTWFQMEVTS
jgi:hypothetical protein